MQSVSLFELASQQAQWISARQKAVASNIANVNTNGYTALEVAPFKEVLNNGTNGASAGSLTLTNSMHMASSSGNSAYVAQERERPETKGLGTGISIEKELIDAGDIRKRYELNTAIVKSFHRMMLMTARAK